MTDPIADMLTRIRNASAVKKADLVLPMSKIKYNIAKILETEGWIKKAEIIKGGEKGAKNSNFDQLKIVLKYKKNGKPCISNLKKVSKPGLKVYVKKDEIPKVLNGFGLAIISTSNGLMTNRQAKEAKVGGELICQIY
ncbi:MAG: 30S ribosomal protein S8 [Candidatus Pacebacteria bacterium]|nr:30S ribosomal protein S8 [Candidatus Paceibacterota bacterium]